MFISFPAAEKVMWRIVTGSPFLTWEPAWAAATGTVHHGADSACLPLCLGTCASLNTFLTGTPWGLGLSASSGKRPGMLSPPCMGPPCQLLISDHLAQDVSNAKGEKPCLRASSGLGNSIPPPNSHLTSDTDFITVPGFQC